MALIKCPECGAEISDKAILCPRCGAEITAKDRAKGYVTTENTIQSDVSGGPDFAKNPQKVSIRGVLVAGFVCVLLAVGALLYFGAMANYIFSGPDYYVAQVPSTVGEALFDWTGVVDGYIHKGRSCCQSVVNYWNSHRSANSDLEAEVVRIKLEQTAYKNYKGQAVPYKSALHLCPICW